MDHGIGTKDGFTLVEIILAILVISIGVLGVTSALSLTTSRSLNAEVIATAKELAQERMEELIATKRNNGYADSTFNIGPAVMTFTALAAPFNKYSRGVQVCLVNTGLSSPDCDPAAPNNDFGYKRIAVSVDYTGLSNLPSPAATVVTVIANVRE